MSDANQVIQPPSEKLSASPHVSNAAKARLAKDYKDITKGMIVFEKQIQSMTKAMERTLESASAHSCLATLWEEKAKDLARDAVVVEKNSPTETRPILQNRNNDDPIIFL